MIRRFTYLLFFLVLSFGLNAQDVIKDLEDKLSQATSDADKIDLLLQLSKANLHRNADASLLHLNSARNLFSNSINDSLKFNTYAGYVNYYFIRQRYKEITVYIDSTSMYKESAAPQAQISVLARLAQSSFFLNEFDKAVEAYKMSLEISEANNLLKSKVGILNQISSVYRRTGDYDNAEKYVNEALKLNESRSLGDVMYSKVLLGKIKSEQSKTEEALELLNEVYDYTLEHRDPVLLHSVNSYLSEIYYDQNDFEKSLKHSRQNLGINTKIRNTIGILSSKSQIASILIKQRKYDSAIAYIKGYIPVAKEVNSLTFVEEGYLMLAQNYELKNNYSESLKYRKLYEKWNDSVLNSEHLEAVSELRIKYETEKNQKDLLALSEKNLKDEVAIERQQAKIRQLTFGLIGGLLFFGGAFVIYRQHFRNKKQRDLLTAITETQTKEGIRIAKDLHDSVGGSLALTKNKLEQLFDSNSDKAGDIAPFIEILSKTGDQIREISHNMMPSELLKFGLVSALQSLMDHAKNENFDTHFYYHGFSRRLDSPTELNIYRICQEALQNVIKHANAQNFTINLNKHDTFISLLIEDDGCGFSEEKKLQKGMGLQNIDNRVALLNGKMKISSLAEKGTTFDIKIPIS